MAPRAGELDAARAREQSDARDKPAVAADGLEGPSVMEVDGSWTLTNYVETTSDEPFEDLVLVSRLRLAQRGNRVTGTGHKWQEHGRTIPRRNRTSISLEGTLKDRRLELTFIERGLRA